MKRIILSFIAGVVLTFVVLTYKGNEYVQSVIDTSPHPLFSTHYEQVFIEGDEMPGIGASKEKPDVAQVWYDTSDHNYHIKYVR